MTLWLRALSLTLISVAVPLTAATLNVTNTNDSGTGSLRAALTAASASTDEDTINLPNGDYVLATGQFNVSGRVLIQGQSSAETVIDGDYQFRVFQLSANASVEMSDLQIINARSVGSFAYGGAIENFGSLMMTQCRIASCESSAEGGGIANDNTYPSEATTILHQCELTYITGRDGGAVANFGHFVAIDTLFDHNIGNQGAALADLTAGGDALLVNCTLSNNQAAGNGGAIAHFSNNAGNTLIMVNCTISGNHAGNVGGAMFHYGTPAVTRLFNVTITDNEANNHSGGVYANTGGCNLSHTIIAGNRSPSAGYSDIAGTFISRGYNLIGDAGVATLTGPQTGDIKGTTADPLDAHLGPLANYGGLYPTNPPTGDSPAINGGNPAGAVDNTGAPLLRDQRGVTRPQCGAPDIGAVEVLPVTDPEDIVRYLLGLGDPPLCLDVNEDHVLDIADFVALL
jgi:hypothetical protein